MMGKYSKLVGFQKKDHTLDQGGSSGLQLWKRDHEGLGPMKHFNISGSFPRSFRNSQRIFSCSLCVPYPQ